ncbi:xanthine dehydrogenase accessory factor [Rhodoblastus acidophilus]|uniref:XdhC family protein n=1 Tax=Rhodoblastus acidophilus TaxID=1074 RepID=UPI0022248E32|nr:XdhC/CoxI family protein [Rhodoblastus acidophilus]MCW2282883.1 xanthine dehydrogenase accessory factor [Rhodoblastus acidophilus]MCW2331744.1 xanthine dehydrogenase accessory factor [Rhodoblastus acidophilus]
MPFKQSRSFDGRIKLALRRLRSHFNAMGAPKDIVDLVGAVTSDAEAIAVATVVRSVRGRAPFAGARAVIAADGFTGWLSGPAGRDVFRAAKKTLEDGRPLLLRTRTKAGALDLLVEPLLPRPNLVIAGAALVAVALADLARRLGFFVTICAPEKDHASFAEADRLVDGFAPPGDLLGDLYIVATQGAEAALPALARLPARYLAVVGPRRRLAALKRSLARDGVVPAVLDTIRSPAGLDIGAVTPEEIALAILAEMVAIRRKGQRIRAR